MIGNGDQVRSAGPVGLEFVIRRRLAAARGPCSGRPNAFESERVVAVFASRSGGASCRREATSGGPARDAVTRARHTAACHARASGPPLRHAEPPSHPPPDALGGFLISGEGTTPSRFQGG